MTLGRADGVGGRVVVRLEGAALTYPGPPPVPALRPTDLMIEAGEFVAVVGPSGSGKSTLLNVLGLLDRPTAGRYELDGYDTGSLSEVERSALRGRRIGFVFQAFHLLPYRSALENVALAQFYAGMPRRERDRVAATALHRVGLAHRLHAMPTTLSGGERQRVAIARALAAGSERSGSGAGSQRSGRGAGPSLLLCDEPTGNLDTATSEAVLDLIGALHSDGMTVVVITHDPTAAARAGRILHMRDGVVADGPAAGPGGVVAASRAGGA